MTVMHPRHRTRRPTVDGIIDRIPVIALIVALVVVVIVATLLWRSVLA